MPDSQCAGVYRSYPFVDCNACSRHPQSGLDDLIFRIGRKIIPIWPKENHNTSPRYVTGKLKTALNDTPVVLLNGPRQCGKTTLLQNLPDSKREYVTLDVETVLAAARQDPVGLRSQLQSVAIDKIQRAPDQNEVDIVIENEAGEILGIEVKAAATAIASDFKGLRRLADLSGDDFKLGIVLYDGEQTLPFGEKLFAAPISSIWS